jgi:hypothetical protein
MAVIRSRARRADNISFCAVASRSAAPHRYARKLAENPAAHSKQGDRRLDALAAEF